MLTRQAWAKSPGDNPLLEPHFPARAKRMIFILLDGGLSQVDSYDYKPRLQKEHGQELPESIRTPKFTFAQRGRIIGSPFDFKQWGETGHWASDLFPEVNRKWIDKLASSTRCTTTTRITPPRYRCSTPECRERSDPRWGVGCSTVSDPTTKTCQDTLTSPQKTIAPFPPAFFPPSTPELPSSNPTTMTRD